MLKDADLIFADPDNGITYKKTPRHKGCEKYTLPEEIALYYYSGKDVVFYCHKGRRTAEAWEQMILQIKESICDAKLFMLTFHRGTQRSYIFVVHPEKANEFDSLLKEFITTTAWGKKRAFTQENVTGCKANSTPGICRTKTGFAGPTIGTIYPKGSTVLYNDDGTITIVPPLDEE